MMNKKIIQKTVLAMAVLAAGTGISYAGDIDKQIARARAAAPAAVSADATIMVNGKVVVEGSNGWTCMPDTMPGDGAAMCNDALWGEMMTAVGHLENYGYVKRLRTSNGGQRVLRRRGSTESRPRRVAPASERWSATSSGPSSSATWKSNCSQRNGAIENCRGTTSPVAVTRTSQGPC